MRSEQITYGVKDAARHVDVPRFVEGFAADPNLPALAAGTPVHFICYEFRGRELVRLEEVFPAG